MKIGKIFIPALLVMLTGVTLSAQNREYYRLDNIQTQHYISLSRDAVQKNNLTLACLYAKKAVQANAWSKVAWENYDDVVKRLVKSGKVADFTAKIGTQNSVYKPQRRRRRPVAPTADDGQSQYEGC